MQKVLFKGATIINEGKEIVADLLTENKRIVKIDTTIDIDGNVTEVNCDGLWLLPGVIDDQVHFREPGLTHKGTIGTESFAAIAGGTTTFMEMPNTVPNALTQ
jgi:dihydroorotase